jgi:hypothetical protein
MRFNYYIDYRQMQMKAIDEEDGKVSLVLVHREVVKYFEFPFFFGTQTQFGPCYDTADYYRQG